MADVKAVIFDLYGTLIYLAEETKPHERLFADIGLQTPDEVKQARRIALTENFNTLADFVKRINKIKRDAGTKIKSDIEIDIAQYEQELEAEKASASLYSETKSVLGDLRKRNIQVGLISNLASPYKEPFFKLGLAEYFDGVIFSCDAGFKKPDKRIYQKIIGMFNLNPAQALMTGDKVYADVDGPKSIGMNAVYLDRKNPSSSNPSSGSIFTLEGVFGYL